MWLLGLHRQECSSNIANRPVFAGDLDGDGNVELATTDRNPGDVSVLFNKGDGTFDPRIALGIEGSPRSVIAADLDSDNDLDLVLVISALAVLSNGGNDLFRVDSVYVGDWTGQEVISADLNDDGYVDIAHVSQNHRVAAFLNQNSVCCVDLNGGIDNDPLELIDLCDLTALIDYLFISFTVPVCFEEANVDGSADEKVDLGDLTALIDYLFISFTPPAECL